MPRAATGYLLASRSAFPCVLEPAVGVGPVCPTWRLSTTVSTGNYPRASAGGGSVPSRAAGEAPGALDGLPGLQRRETAVELVAPRVLVRQGPLLDRRQPVVAQGGLRQGG